MGREREVFSPMELSALQEIGTIGAGNAATALSQLLQRKILISVPRVRVVDITELPEAVGGPEEVVVAVYIYLYKDLRGRAMFAWPLESAKRLTDFMLGRKLGETKEIGEFEMSAITEIGNVLLGAYLNAIGQFTNLFIRPTPPAGAVDMIEAIMSVIAVELGSVADYVPFIETEFTAEGEKLKGYFLLVLDPDSFKKLFDVLGVSGQ